MTTTQFTSDGEMTERDRLLIEHLPLVHHVARQVLRRRNLDLDVEDLVSAGTVGLIEALEKFDPSRGLAISTFATPRIQGAILDELRRLDPLGRTARRRQREIHETRETLAQEYGRAPRTGEIADRLGVDPDDVATWEGSAQRAESVSLERPLRLPGGNRAHVSDVVADDQSIPAEQVVERRERTRILREEILALDERDRLVLSLYYFEELKLQEIADLLGVSESRVSQIRSRAVGELRERLKERLGSSWVMMEMLP